MRKKLFLLFAVLFIYGCSRSNLDTGTTTLLYTDANGNVGIGTITPASTLHVNGNISASDPTVPEHVVTKRYVDHYCTNPAPSPSQPAAVKQSYCLKGFCPPQMKASVKNQ